jgi:hypothetical protein
VHLCFLYCVLVSIQFLSYLSKQITLQRTWGKMPLWHKIKLVYSIVSQAVFLPNPKELEKMVKSFLLPSFFPFL